jgi:hypothetical protein
MAAQITDEYAAGIIEARGKLYTNTGGTQRRYRPKIDVYLLDHRVAQVLLHHFACGKVAVGSPSHAPNSRVYVWTVKGAGAVGVLERTAPYMVGDVGQHAEFILERDQARQPNGKVELCKKI